MHSGYIQVVNRKHYIQVHTHTYAHTNTHTHTHTHTCTPVMFVNGILCWESNLRIIKDVQLYDHFPSTLHFATTHNYIINNNIKVVYISEHAHSYAQQSSNPSNDVCILCN